MPVLRLSKGYLGRGRGHDDGCAPFNSQQLHWRFAMTMNGLCRALVGVLVVGFFATSPALAQGKPNILFIMGDDIGIMQRGCLPPRDHGRRNAEHRSHRERGRDLHGLLRHAELHLRAQRLLHRHGSGARRPDRAAASRAVRPGCDPARRRSPRCCSTWATRPASSARTTWAITPRRCRRRTASRNTGATCTTWMRCKQVSFPDINKTPTEQGIAPPGINTPIPGS